MVSSGLAGSDERQITKPSDKRLQTDDKRGIVVLLEAVHACHTIKQKSELAEQLCSMVIAGLQHESEARPTMALVQKQLKKAWQISQMAVADVHDAPSDAIGRQRGESQYTLPVSDLGEIELSNLGETELPIVGVARDSNGYEDVETEVVPPAVGHVEHERSELL